MPNLNVSVLEAHHPRYSHVVTYPDGGVRKRRYFTGVGKARTFARIKETEVANQGTAGQSITDKERRALADHRDVLQEHGKTLRDALEFYTEHLARVDQSCPVHELRDKLIQRRRTEGKSKRHITDLEYRLGAFVADHGDRMVADVTTDEIDRWLANLGLAPVTVINYRRILHNLFGEAVRRKLIPTNPVADTIRPKVIETEVGILTVPEARSLLQCCSPEVKAAVAIGLFAGLRRSEVEKLNWSEIDREYVLVRGNKAKGSRRRLVKILRPLSRILKQLRSESGPVVQSPWVYRSRLEKAIDASSIEVWPDNALRHSFASYHLAHFKDAEALALELGHTDTKIIFQYYREVVRPTEAKAFWSL